MFQSPRQVPLENYFTKNTMWHGTHIGNNKPLQLQSIFLSIIMDEHEYDIDPM
jgi:hypothetical protein